MPANADLLPHQKAKVEVVDAWVKKLLVRAGVRLVNFRKDGEAVDAYGLLNVPAKYVGIIDAMHQAIVAAALGQPLPEFAPLPEVSVKRVKRRR